MYEVAGIQVSQCNLSSLETNSNVFHAGLNPSQTVLNAGHQREEGKLAFKLATIFDRDVQIIVRDGTALYADIFRPHNVLEQVPAIINWSPYGKTGQGIKPNFTKIHN